MLFDKSSTSSGFESLESMLRTAGEAIYTFPPVQFLITFLKLYVEFIMDRMVQVSMSFLLGMVTLLALEVFILWRYYKSSPVQPPPKFRDGGIHLPEVLKTQLGQPSLKQKEDCIWLNFFMQFIFAELKDSLQLRRFLTKKIQTEFEEVLKSRTGVLVDELFLRDFHLGENFPVIMGISVDRSDIKDDVIQTLDLKTRIVYDGGFQIAIDAALPFSRMAYVSVRILKLRGLMRFQFTLVPFSHWSMSFYEEPELEVDVTAQLDGRPMPKLKNIIAGQIRRIIRKKHTLPMYKIRHKPFFLPRPDPGRAAGRHLTIDGEEIGQGILEVTVICANRLPFVVKGAKMYCTVSVDELPWKQLMAEERKRRRVMAIELIRNSADQSLGMTVKDELLPDRLHPVVVIEEVTLGFPAHLANVQQGDILVGVGGNKVLSAKQAMKNLKWAKDNRIHIQVERKLAEDGHATTKDDMAFPRKVNSWHSAPRADLNSGSGYAPSVNSESLYSINTTSTSLASTIGKVSTSQQRKVRDSRKTTVREASEDPFWNQKFIFGVDPNDHFLNVCVWSKGGDRTGKPEAISSAKEDVLIGYVSLNLDDIYLHCLITLNGTMQDKVKLKHGHYKTEAELIKAWSIHKGFDPNQMYGDITLGFHFFPTVLTQQQRQTLSGCKAASIRLQKELFERYQSSPASAEQERNVTMRKSETFKTNLSEGHHQFDSASFITATFCDYCGKKIWMKEAFKCRTCSMVCHKKCLVKCLVNTFCTETGVKKRGALDEAWEPLTTSGKVRNVNVEDLGIKALVDDDDLDEADEMSTMAESAANFGTLMDSIYTDQTATPKKSEPEVNPMNRFRVLRDQTDKMKDNVMKHLKRNKVTNAMSDQAIMSAKEAGARLFVDLDPSLRKDKLEELVKKLDDQLKAEMENKEAIEQELSFQEAVDQKATNPKRKSEIRSLQNKAQKSAEKQDAMRLLMLQYCSGLQTCINALESEAKVTKSTTSSVKTPKRSEVTLTKSEPAKTSRSAAVGGFMRRAGSSVKEKVSSIKKDLARKGGRNPDDQPSTSGSKNNNYDLNPITEKEEGILQVNVEEPRKSARSKSVGQVEELIKKNELDTRQDILEQPDIALSDSISLPSSFSHPGIEIRIDDVDKVPEGARLESGDAEANGSTQEDHRITRSSSDSGLELKKMLSLSPEDILRYHSSSLPRLLGGDESDSDSDYLVIDSSDEPAVTDSSDSDVEIEDVNFETGRGRANTVDSEDGNDQHRSTSQQLQTYKV